MTTVLVETGYGRAERARAEADGLADLVAADIAEAVTRLLAHAASAA
jgi:hypothetical protein